MTFEQAKQIIIGGGLVGVEFPNEPDTDAYTCESLEELGQFRNEECEFYRI